MIGPSRKDHFGLSRFFSPEELKGTYALPKIQDRSFEARKIDFRGNLVKVRPHSGKTPACDKD